MNVVNVMFTPFLKMSRGRERVRTVFYTDIRPRSWLC